MYVRGVHMRGVLRGVLEAPVPEMSVAPNLCEDIY